MGSSAHLQMVLELLSKGKLDQTQIDGKSEDVLWFVVVLAVGPSEGSASKNMLGGGVWIQMSDVTTPPRVDAFRK